MNHRTVTGLLLALLLGFTTAGWTAAIDAFEFDSSEQEVRFRQLSSELRCLVCQNQTIADSNAELAQDLRREVFEMIKEGQSDAEIVDFLVARYGDFVLYRPPVTTTTALLWAGPFLLIAIGLFFLIRFIRTRVATTESDTALSAEEQTRLDALLQTPTKDERS